MGSGQRTFLQGLSDTEKNALLSHAEAGAGPLADGGPSKSGRRPLVAGSGGQGPFEQKRHSISTERERSQQLGSQVTSLQAKLNEQSDQLNALRSERDAVRLQLLRNDDRSTRLASQLASLEQENSALSAKLLAANNDRAQLQAKLEAMQIRVLELQQGYVAMASCDDGMERRDLIRRTKINGLMADVAATGVLDADLQQLASDLPGRAPQQKLAMNTITALTRERDTLQQRLNELADRLAESVSREAATRGAQALRSASWKRSAVQAEARLSTALKRVKELNEELRKRDGESRQREKYLAQLERTVMAQHRSLQQLRRLLEKGVPGPNGGVAAAPPPRGNRESARPASASPNGRGAGGKKSAKQELPPGVSSTTVRWLETGSPGRGVPPGSPSRQQWSQQQPQQYQYPFHFLQKEQELASRSAPGGEADEWASQHAGGQSAGGNDPWAGGHSSPSHVGQRRPLALSADGAAPNDGGRGACAEGYLQFEAPSSSDGQDAPPRGARSSSPPPAALHHQLVSMEASLAQLYRELEQFKDSSLLRQGLAAQAGGTSNERGSSPRSPNHHQSLPSSPTRREYDQGHDTNPERDVGVAQSDMEAEGRPGGGFAFPPSLMLRRRPQSSPAGGPGNGRHQVSPDSTPGFHLNAEPVLNRSSEDKRHRRQEPQSGAQAGASARGALRPASSGSSCDTGAHAAQPGQTDSVRAPVAGTLGRRQAPSAPQAALSVSFGLQTSADSHRPQNGASPSPAPVSQSQRGAPLQQEQQQQVRRAASGAAAAAAVDNATTRTCQCRDCDCSYCGCGKSGAVSVGCGTRAAGRGPPAARGRGSQPSPPATAARRTGPAAASGPVARRPATAAAVAVVPEVCDEGPEEQPRQPLPTHMLSHLLRCAHHGYGNARVSPRGGGVAGGRGGGTAPASSPMTGRAAGRGAGGGAQRTRAVRSASSHSPRVVPVATASGGAHPQQMRGTVTGSYAELSESRGRAAQRGDRSAFPVGARAATAAAAETAATVKVGHPGEQQRLDLGRGGRAEGWLSSRSDSPVGGAVDTPRAAGRSPTAPAPSSPAGAERHYRETASRSSEPSPPGSPSVGSRVNFAAGAARTASIRIPPGGKGPRGGSETPWPRPGSSPSPQSALSPPHGAGAAPAAVHDPQGHTHSEIYPTSPEALSPISTLLASIATSPRKSPPKMAAAAAHPQCQPHFQSHPHSQSQPQQCNGAYDDVSSRTIRGGSGCEHQRPGSGPWVASTLRTVAPESSASGSNSGSRAGAKRRQHDGDDADGPEERRKARGSSNGGGKGSASCASSRPEMGGGGSSSGGSADGSGSRTGGSSQDQNHRTIADLNTGQSGPSVPASRAGRHPDVCSSDADADADAAGWKPPAERPSNSGNSGQAYATGSHASGHTGPSSPRFRTTVPPGPHGSSWNASDSLGASTSKGPAGGRPTLAGWLGDAGSRASSGQHPAVSNTATGPAAAESGARSSPSQRSAGMSGSGSPMAAAAAAAATALQRLRDKRMQRLQATVQRSAVRPRETSPPWRALSSRRGASHDGSGTLVVSLRGSLQGEVIVSPSRLVSPLGSQVGSPVARYSPSYAGAGGDCGIDNGEVTVHVEVTSCPLDWHNRGPAPPPGTSQPPAAASSAQSSRSVRSSATGCGTACSEARLGSSDGLVRTLPALAESSGHPAIVTYATGRTSAEGRWSREESHVAQGLVAHMAWPPGSADDPMSAGNGAAVTAAALPPQPPSPTQHRTMYHPHPHPLMQLLGQASQDLQLLSNRLKPLVEPR